MHKNTVIAITNGNMCVDRHASEIIETKKMHIEREQQQQQSNESLVSANSSICLRDGIWFHSLEREKRTNTAAFYHTNASIYYVIFAMRIPYSGTANRGAERKIKIELNSNDNFSR